TPPAHLAMLPGGGYFTFPLGGFPRFALLPSGPMQRVAQAEGLPMSSAPLPPPEQGQLRSARSRRWIVKDLRPSTLPPPPMPPSRASPPTPLTRPPQPPPTPASTGDGAPAKDVQVLGGAGRGAQVAERAALPAPTCFTPPRPAGCLPR